MSAWLGLLREDDVVVLPQGTGEPRTLTEALVDGRTGVGRMRVFLGATFSDTFQPHHGDHIQFLSFGAIGTAGALVRSGVCRVVPVHISTIPRLFREHLRPDVVFLHLSGDSVDGRHSFGIVDDYLVDAVSHARVLIGEVNERMPFMHGGNTIALSDLDAVVHSNRDLLEMPRQDPTPDAEEIGRQVAALIPDGACLQMGIGSAPNAVMDALKGHRRLGIHSGLMTDAFYELHASDAVDNSAKLRNRHVSIAGACFGSRDLYEGLAADPDYEMRAVSETHAPGVFTEIERFHAINSALQVDLTGQVNAEVAGSAYVGATGGQVDFVKGAATSIGGRAIIVLSATARKGTVSRIVPTLSMGSVTTARSDVHTIVTEYGEAQLEGLSLQERGRELVKIAAPQFRADLMEQIGGAS